MLKKRIFVAAILTILLISIKIESRLKKCKCNSNPPPNPPPTNVVKCNDGFVKIGSNNLYIKCVDCLLGNDIGGSDPTQNLDYKLNIVKIFGSSGWMLGGTFGPGLSNINNVLGLTYDSGTKIYSFTKTFTSNKFEVVISLFAGNCYTTYLFSCLEFNSIKQIFYNTLGVDKGTGQDLSHMTYFYRDCSNPTTCSIKNPTQPPKTDIDDCTDFGSVASYINGVLTNSQACFGSYTGNLNDCNCTQDNKKGDVCLFRVLNSTPNPVCQSNWCCVEKLDVSGIQMIGKYWTLNVDKYNGSIGTFSIANNLLGPFVIVLKASNAYSAYFIKSGFTGEWSTSFHDLSHAVLWAPCSGMSP